MFKTPVVSFAGYLGQSPGNAFQAAPHYEIVFPFLPTGIGVCDGTGTASAYSFIGQTTSQAQFPEGFGRPGTAGVRAIESFEGGSGPVTGNGSLQGYDWNGVQGNPPTLAFDSGNKTCTVVRPAIIASLGTAYPCGVG